ncbi:hypothetical protein JOD54_005017 [Actinokineospora baliensis]|uniref:hypothetical protein n=1 Tax=Actinokineospora baliensis TaxID=547056 RepID=UPI0019597255|nr:hypothetical protein [Actinokineospora baliensis]MBM7774813.1 hypothetical protein [Actinokineospora baliensis]
MRAQWIRKAALLAVLFLVVPAPAAPAAVAASAPITGAGLTVDFYTALDLAAQGVAESTIGGSGHVDGDVNLKVAKGSSLTYGSELTGGRVLLLGGVRLTTATDTVLISGMSVTIATGVITAKVGGQVGVRVGQVTPAGIRAVKPARSTTVTFKLAENGITLDDDFAAAVNDALGTSLSTGTAADATLDIDVELVRGLAPDAALLAILGLDADLTATELLASTVDVTLAGS